MSNHVDRIEASIAKIDASLASNPSATERAKLTTLRKQLVAKRAKFSA